ncbi:MAG TPA: hypothetical protein VK907_04850, partial [Phnomibacter sp.]|nr:hypothetical protein [Phnomibacter sp.]
MFMVFIILGVQWGFYASYTSQFPHFKNATPTIHVHGALLMTWLLLLVVQPLFIHTGRAHLHRTIGKLSWFLGPAIVVSLYLIGRQGYHRALSVVPLHENLTFIALDSRGLFSFAIFWLLAMLNRKQPDVHMRYMIATGLLAIGPGIGRGFATLGLEIGPALALTDLISLAIVGALLGYDIFRRKNFKPFLLVFCVLLTGALLWQIRDTDLWQGLARFYAETFY